MSCFPGLNVFGATDRSPNIFADFFPIPDNIGNMRREDDYILKHAFTLNAPISFIKGFEGEGPSKKEYSILVDKESQNPDEELKDILHQTQIICELNHKNVLKFYEFISGKDLTDVAYVFEPIDGFLSDLIKEDIPKLYEPSVVKKIMKDLFSALDYLHQNRIIHRDIQPENIAFSSNGVLKVWNFRNARKFHQKTRKLFKINEFRYQAVDLLMLSENYDESVDIWAANCIFAELWLKKSLFPKNEREKILLAIFKLLGFPKKEIWEEFYSIPGTTHLPDLSKHYKFNMLNSYFEKHCIHITPSAMDLMHRCFRYNPKYRPSAEQCLIHPYFYEEPEACPAEDIISILEQKFINEQIRMIRTRNQQSP